MLEIVERKKIREKSIKEIKNIVSNARKCMVEFLDYLNNYTKDEYDIVISIVAMGDFLKKTGELINKRIQEIEKTV